MVSLRIISLSVLFVCSSTSGLYAVRDAPKKVKPIEKDGVIYSAPPFVHVDIRGLIDMQNGGYILAKETNTGRLKWLTQVYVTKYDEKLEQDVQDVFITEIRLDKDNLIIKDERNRTFLLNIKTLEVTPEPQKSSESKFIEIDPNSIQGVIIPKEYFHGFRKAPVPIISGYWTIGKFDFENLDNHLEKYLREKAKLPNGSKQLPDRFRTYERQYVGVLVGGKKMILINFFCESLENWKSHFVKSDAGGDCFFQVEYDIETQKFINLQINADA